MYNIYDISPCWLLIYANNRSQAMQRLRLDAETVFLFTSLKCFKVRVLHFLSSEGTKE